MADLYTLMTDGGQKTAAVAAGSGAADVVVSAKPGRVCKVIVSTVGTASLELYDHASASSGAKLIWKTPATTPVAGTITELDIPVEFGIVAKQASGSAAVTISYTEDKVSGSGPDKTKVWAKGGNKTSVHAAGAGGAGAALAAPGRLCRIVVLAQGSVVTNIYDNASAASGTILFQVAASGTTAVAAGTVYDVQMPAAAGIYVGGASNTSQILVTYSTQQPFGL